MIQCLNPSAWSGSRFRNRAYTNHILNNIKENVEEKKDKSSKSITGLHVKKVEIEGNDVKTPRIYMDSHERVNRYGYVKTELAFRRKKRRKFPWDKLESLNE